jgi:hypothetical protein
MKTTNRKLWAVVAIVAVIALIAIAACQAPPATPTGTVHVVLDNAYEIGASGDGPASAAGDTNLTNLVTSGNVTVGGGLTVTGGVTGTNVLTTGNQNVAGIKTFTTPPVITGLTGPLKVTGPTAVTTATPATVIDNTGAGNVTLSVRDAATPIFEILNGGAATFSGAVDIAGNPSYGALDLRPVGNAANGKIYEFGVTGVVTGTVITPVAITTVTAYGCQVNSPAVASAWSCGTSLSGRALTIRSYEIDATPVATPAKSMSWWIAGN